MRLSRYILFRSICITIWEWNAIVQTFSVYAGVIEGRVEMRLRRKITIEFLLSLHD